MRFLQSVIAASLAWCLLAPPLVEAQSTINPNQIARGKAYTTNNVAGAVSFCGAVAACEWHITGQANIATTQTLGANISLFFEGGGQIVVAAGVTLTVNGKVVAPPGVQIFAGAGSVAGIHRVDPAWYPAGYTVAKIASLIPDAPDATILPWSGVLDSGTETGVITRTYLTILGAGAVGYNSGYTALTGGSLIQGELNLTIPNLTVTGVGFDLGSYQAAHGGWCAGDSSGNNSLGNLVDIMLPGGNTSNISVWNVTTLGCTASSPGHSILIEGFDGVSIGNIHTHFNTRGVVSKSGDTTVSNVDSREHGGECLIFKSDATNGGVGLLNLTATNVTCTDTVLVDLFADDAALYNVKIVDLTMNGGGYLDLNGFTVSHGGNVDQVDITNFRSNGAVGNAIQTVGGIGSVNITGGGVYGSGSAGLFANSGLINVANFTAGYLSASAYGIVNNGAVVTVVGGHGINLTNAYIHGVSGATRYVGSTSDGNNAIVADGNAQLYVPIPYDSWGAGNLTAPYGALNYFAKFTSSDSHYDHAVSVFGLTTAQLALAVGNAPTNQKRSLIYADSGTTRLSFMDDTTNGTTGSDVWVCYRSGYTPTGCSFSVPITVPSIVPLNGFTGSKVAGACTLTITSGIITNVSGC